MEDFIRLQSKKEKEKKLMEDIESKNLKWQLKNFWPLRKLGSADLKETLFN